MAAIAHGWRPTGSAADIPVKVAKEFHKSDAGRKYGSKIKRLRSRGVISDKQHEKLEGARNG